MDLSEVSSSILAQRDMNAEEWSAIENLREPSNILVSDESSQLCQELFVTRYEKKGQLTEKHILQDRRKYLPAHANALFALLRLITTNPSKSPQA